MKFSLLKRSLEKFTILTRFLLPKDQCIFPNCYITCAGKTDGAGAQALAVLSTQLFAHQAKITYVHTPFKYIEHNMELDSNWVQNWEDFFNLGFEELSITDIELANLRRVEINDLSEIKPWQSNCLYIVSQCHIYANLFPNRYQLILINFQKKYYNNTKKVNLPNINLHETNIAVHIRRGDVQEQGNFANRFTSNDNLKQIIECLLESISSFENTFVIRIYSQGTIQDFKGILEYFPNCGIQLHLNECAFITFQALVDSDILVMSKSTFSYVAAFLNCGVKIYDPFYHPPLRDWLVLNRRYKFNKKQFSINLESFLNQKNSNF